MGLVAVAWCAVPATHGQDPTTPSAFVRIVCEARCPQPDDMLAAMQYWSVQTNNRRRFATRVADARDLFELPNNASGFEVQAQCGRRRWRLATANMDNQIEGHTDRSRPYVISLTAWPPKNNASCWKTPAQIQNWVPGERPEESAERLGLAVDQEYAWRCGSLLGAGCAVVVGAIAAVTDEERALEPDVFSPAGLERVARGQRAIVKAELVAALEGLREMRAAAVRAPNPEFLLAEIDARTKTLVFARDLAALRGVDLGKLVTDVSYRQALVVRRCGADRTCDASAQDALKLIERTLDAPLEGP